MKRQSNFELCRVVSMFMIVLHHLLVHGLKAPYGYAFSSGSSSTLYTLLDSFLFVAVNSFILISGFFSINFKPKKFISLYLQCSVYGGIAYLIHILISDANIGKSFIHYTVFSILTNQGWWFIKEYIYLMLLAPFINAGINAISKKQLLQTIIALSVISVYFG